MAVPSSKEELIKVINSIFSLLHKKLESITPQIAFKPLLEEHISMVNLVSYLIGWGLYCIGVTKRGKGKLLFSLRMGINGMN